MEKPRRILAQFYCQIFPIVMIFGELSTLFSHAHASDTSTGSGSTICFYYPVYPNTSVVNQTTCQYQCCTDTAKSLEDTCCQSGSKWWISLIVVFGFLYICAVVVIYGCGRYCIGSKKRRAKRPNTEEYAYPAGEESRATSYVIPNRTETNSMANGERANRSNVEFRTNRASTNAPNQSQTNTNLNSQIRQSSYLNTTTDTHFDDQLPKYDDLTKRASFLSKSQILREEAAAGSSISVVNITEDANQANKASSNRRASRNSNSGPLDNKKF